MGARIVFRVDSSATIGSGHVMRCLTLANELVRLGAGVAFVSRLLPGHLMDRIETAGYPVYRLSQPLKENLGLRGYAAWLGVSIEQDINETRQVLKNTVYDWMVIDHYALDHIWESALRVNANKVLVIDDLANRVHDCDVLLDQNYFGGTTAQRYDGYMPQTAQALLGPEFALLQPIYANLHEKQMPADRAINRALIFLGASDNQNISSIVLDAFSAPELSHISLDVVIGVNHPNPALIKQQVKGREHVKLHSNLPTLADLMMCCDIVISAGGSTTWERMCLGKPAVVACVADNQKSFSRQLAADGYQILLEGDEILSNKAWYHAITKLVLSTSKLQAMRQKANSLVDGLGCSRVAQVMIGHVTPQKKKVLYVSILSDQSSWSVHALQALQSQWVQDGHQVTFVHHPSKLTKGDVCFILGCSKILTTEQLGRHTHNLVVHASNLPYGRGWSPMTWQILEGRNEICMTIFEALPELDAGPIYEQKWLKLNGMELIDAWQNKQMDVTKELCCNWLEAFLNDALQFKYQSGEGSYYPRRRPCDSELDPDMTLREQFNLLRVVDNKRYPAFVYLNNKQYQILIEEVEAL